MNIQQATKLGLRQEDGLDFSMISRKVWRSTYIKVFNDSFKTSHKFDIGFHDLMADDWVALFPSDNQTFCIAGKYYTVIDTENTNP